MAKGDIFLWLYGIGGESKDEYHKNEIRLLSYQWDRVPAQAQSDRDPVLEPATDWRLRVTKPSDKSSVLLRRTVVTGARMAMGKLTQLGARGDTRWEALTYRLEDLYVTSASRAGDATEIVGFNVGKVYMEYLLRAPDGKMKPPDDQQR